MLGTLVAALGVHGVVFAAQPAAGGAADKLVGIVDDKLGVLRNVITNAAPQFAKAAEEQLALNLQVAPRLNSLLQGKLSDAELLDKPGVDLREQAIRSFLRWMNGRYKMCDDSVVCNIDGKHLIRGKRIFVWATLSASPSKDPSVGSSVTYSFELSLNDPLWWTFFGDSVLANWDTPYAGFKQQWPVDEARRRSQPYPDPKTAREMLFEWARLMATAPSYSGAPVPFFDHAVNILSFPELSDSRVQYHSKRRWVVPASLALTPFSITFRDLSDNVAKKLGKRTEVLAATEFNKAEIVDCQQVNRISQWDILERDIAPLGDEDAVKYIRMHDDEGSVDAKAMRAIWMLHGRRGLPRDVPGAIRLLKEAVLKKSCEATSTLAALYLSGDGVDKDPREALRLLDLAGNLGDLAARARAGELLCEGTLVERDAARGERLIAASMESAAGLLVMGKRMLTTSPKEGLFYLHDAARCGSLEAAVLYAHSLPKEVANKDAYPKIERAIQFAVTQGEISTNDVSRLMEELARAKKSHRN